MMSQTLAFGPLNTGAHVVLNKARLGSSFNVNMASSEWVSPLPATQDQLVNTVKNISAPQPGMLQTALFPHVSDEVSKPIAGEHSETDLTMNM